MGQHGGIGLITIDVLAETTSAFGIARGEQRGEVDRIVALHGISILGFDGVQHGLVEPSGLRPGEIEDVFEQRREMARAVAQ